MTESVGKEKVADAITKNDSSESPRNEVQDSQDGKQQKEASEDTDADSDAKKDAKDGGDGAAYFVSPSDLFI